MCLSGAFIPGQPASFDELIPLISVALQKPELTTLDFICVVDD